MNLKEIIKQSVSDAEQGKSRIDSPVLAIDGMSSPKVRHLLNNICHYMEDTRYLEIGTWKGSTLISAAYKNQGTYIGVDNFEHFGGPREEFNENKELFKEHANVSFYDADCWELDLNNIPKI